MVHGFYVKAIMNRKGKRMGGQRFVELPADRLSPVEGAGPAGEFGLLRRIGHNWALGQGRAQGRRGAQMGPQPAGTERFALKRCPGDKRPRTAVKGGFHYFLQSIRCILLQRRAIKGGCRLDIVLLIQASWGKA